MTKNYIYYIVDIEFLIGAEQLKKGDIYIMIKYKIDVLAELKARGYSQPRLMADKILSGATLANIRHGATISMDALNKICLLLRCQPGDILISEPTDEEKIRFF